MDAYGPSVPFYISKGLEKGCQVCHQTTNLQRCSSCKAVFYCNRDHQVSDHPAHKAVCNKITKAQAKLDAKETKLRNHPGDFMTPANPFETSVGHFWGILNTRDYMRARSALLHELLKVNTRQAVQSALDHILNMLRLCRSDNIGVRSIAPALYLRLGRDQDCYDFCKWWATCDPDGHYDWGNMELPYLSTKDADVFEPANPFLKRFPDLAHTVSITLLKIRLLIDLQTLARIERETSTRVPNEIIRKINADAVATIIASRQDILEREDQGPYIKELEKQVKQLYEAVKKANQHFWPAMLKPGNNLTVRPHYTSSGAVSEMQVQLQYSYNSWVETPGAIGVIEELEKGN
ncbi:hypothetical protein PQX77_021672 [Marasmius sp. AFHP31]|nr:hypothetical protein PQX77_021672 [Marasmius sp. AFHP31]